MTSALARVLSLGRKPAGPKANKARGEPNRPSVATVGAKKGDSVDSDVVLREKKMSDVHEAGSSNDEAEHYACGGEPLRSRGASSSSSWAASSSSAWVPEEALPPRRSPAPNHDGATAAAAATTTAPSLSRRGQSGASFIDGTLAKFIGIVGNAYDAERNPKGNVIMGVADNSLMRKELIEYFNKDRLGLIPAEMTYANRIFASKRLLVSIANFFNTIPDGLSTQAQPPGSADVGGRQPSGALQAVLPEHVVVGSGATGILDGVAWVFCDEGEGVVLSAPYYNAFDNDLTLRSKAKILEVDMPPFDEYVAAESAERIGDAAAGVASAAAAARGERVGADGVGRTQEEKLRATSKGLRCFQVDTIKLYEARIQRALREGVTPRVLLVVNPHNPTGAIYPRETLVELAKLAARHRLQLVVDEIYARSCYPSRRNPDPVRFHSLLSIDVEKEAGLPKSSVHIVSSASKDFAINGFRLGIFISQHNPEAVKAMTSLGFLSQTSSPAGCLFASLLEDTPYLHRYLAENRRRLSDTYDYVCDWLDFHGIPYLPASAGHFVLIDLRRFLPVGNGDGAGNGSQGGAGLAGGGGGPPGGLAKDEATEQARQRQQQRLLDAELGLSSRFVDNGVFVAPGSQYHQSHRGWFRLTFSVEAETLVEGLRRIERTLGLPTDDVAEGDSRGHQEGGGPGARGAKSFWETRPRLKHAAF